MSASPLAEEVRATGHTVESLWRTSSPPQDGTAIVAIGRVMASDEFSTWSDPFVAEVFWVKDQSGYEGWHFSRDQMTVARTLDDKVMIDWWAPFPKTEGAS